MEQMPYYVPPEDDWKKHFEGLIPILILILIAVVLVGKTTNYFCAVPLLSDAFCAKGQVNIGLLGDFTDNANTIVKATLFKSVIDSDGGKFNVYTKPIDPRLLEYPQQNLLNKFDIVAIAGVQNLSYAARDALGAYIAGGGKVILIGDAGTKDSRDLAIMGWSAAGFGGYAPVRLADSGSGDIPIKAITATTLNYFSDQHPVIKDYAEAYRIDFTQVSNAAQCGQISAVDVIPNGDIIAILESGDGSNYVPGIVEKKTGISGGNVIYFNYDPGCTIYATISTVRYLAGKG